MLKRDKDGDVIINNAEELEHHLKDRKEKAKQRIMNTDKTVQDGPVFSHTDVANQTLKVIPFLPLDNTIKAIMTKRLIGPLLIGREISHLEIALEFGLREHEVVEMEEFGVIVLSDFLEKHTTKEFIDKFNRDQKVENAVKEIKDKIK